ncbi:MAG TPA: hypothetical protein VFT51_13435 [Bacillales bacterium]|nr:hypothetical protein [Bacillales bacterium]
MAIEKRTSRGITRPLVIFFIILIIGIASFGAYIKWGGSGIQQWAGNLPVVSSFIEDKEVTGTKQKTDELEQFKTRINEQADKINNLEQSLNGKEQQVDRLNDQIEALQQRLTQQQKETSDSNTEENQNVAKIYAEMAPNSAAEIMNQLENNEAIGILSQLKPETAALIIAKMDKEKAAKLTVLWTGNGE